MKKTKLTHDYGLRLAFMLMLVQFAISGCSAHPNSTSASVNSSKEQTDSIMKSMIGDSIYAIITGAKKIKAEEIVLTNDTTKNIASISKAVDVKGKFVPIVQFILSNPQNYSGEMVVYGLFMPCFKLTFLKKKESCILNFDFGLKKWNICDDKERVIKTFDYPSDDMLRFANMLFPENELFKKQINIGKR